MNTDQWFYVGIGVIVGVSLLLLIFGPTWTGASFGFGCWWGIYVTRKMWNC